MTHTTGPRTKIVKRLQYDLMSAVLGCSATISECFEAIHEVQMDLVHTMLRPWEDESCPTCPKAMQKHGTKILRRKKAK